KELGQHIRSRRQDTSHQKNKDEDIAPRLCEHFEFDQPDLGEQDNQQRHFEDQSEGQEHRRNKTQIIFHPWEKLDLRPVEDGDEELEAHRKDQKITKKGASDKKESG